MTVASPLTTEHADTLTVELDTIAEILDELDTTITRTDAVAPERLGSSGHTDPVVPYNQQASDARVHLERTIRNHAGHIAGYLGVAILGNGPRRHAQFLAHTVHLMVGLDGTMRIYDDLTAAIDRAWRTVDRQPSRIYVGACPKCSEGLNTTATARTIKCGCGAEYSVAALRAVALRRARLRSATAAELADLLPRVAGVTISRNTITQWAKRGKLTGQTIGDRTVYRIADVLDIHAARAV